MTTIQTYELPFNLVNTSYDYGFGSSQRHTISTRREFVKEGTRADRPREYVQIEGDLQITGIDLRRGQTIKAVIVIQDEQDAEQ
jgi:hypothetical protein